MEKFLIGDNVKAVAIDDQNILAEVCRTLLIACADSFSVYRSEINFQVSLLLQRFLRRQLSSFIIAVPRLELVHIIGLL